MLKRYNYRRDRGRCSRSGDCRVAVDEVSGQQGLGDMSGAAQEMEEVIKDLKSRKYSRKTYERQERILSRMLDSQKSLTRRGQKEERLATTANQNNVFIGPSGLPIDLGQRQSITIEALNQAMKAGYSRDY